MVFLTEQFRGARGDNVDNVGWGHNPSPLVKSETGF
jgi:hypothetical protein